MSTHPSSQPVTDPTPPFVVAAAELAAVRRLLHQADGDKPRHGGVSIVGPGGEVVPLPNAVVDVIDRAAGALVRGAAVTVLPVDRDLTTQPAASLSNVSRQYLVRLLDEGQLPGRRTGSHHRVRAVDVLALKTARDTRRRSALAELTKVSEDMGGHKELE